MVYTKLWNDCLFDYNLRNWNDLYADEANKSWPKVANIVKPTHNYSFLLHKH